MPTEEAIYLVSLGFLVMGEPIHTLWLPLKTTQAFKHSKKSERVKLSPPPTIEPPQAKKIQQHVGEAPLASSPWHLLHSLPRQGNVGDIFSLRKVGG